MNRKPAITHMTVASIDRNSAKLCGTRCSRPMPSITPETKLIAICIR